VATAQGRSLVACIKQQTSSAGSQPRGFHFMITMQVRRDGAEIGRLYKTYSATLTTWERKMGSHQTAEALTAGDLNFANNITNIVACRYDDEEKPRAYDGFTILLVWPDPDPKQRPTSLTDGVTAYGFGCPLYGPHGDWMGAGTGGVGVIGNGGSGDLNQKAATNFGNKDTFDPGAGVLGIGGFWTGAMVSISDSGKKRNTTGGAGVIGVAAGEHGPPVLPSFDKTQGVGVYGFSAVGTGVVAEGNSLPQSPTTGLLATGFLAIEAKGTHNGIEATDSALDLKVKSTGENVNPGTDCYGVDAEGLHAGIHAVSSGGPAGIFEITLDEKVPRAQLHIKSIDTRVGRKDEEPFVPNVYTGNVDWLPSKGKAGEILVLRPVAPDTPNPVTSWLCVVPGGNFGDPIGSIAMWSQVLLGRQIKGERG
jgi:hypothetical protein